MAVETLLNRFAGLTEFNTDAPGKKPPPCPRRLAGVFCRLANQGLDCREYGLGGGITVYPEPLLCSAIIGSF